MNNILIAIAALGGLGLIFGIILAIASKVFHVQVDPKITQIREALPGVNCGACGFPGCDGLAKAIATGEAPVTACPVASSEAVGELGNIMGVKAEIGNKKVARVMCNGCQENAVDKFKYQGIMDCKAANMISGGSKACSAGCLGLGTCVNVCQFDAIKIENGVAVIDKDKCTSCEKCVDVCPKFIIDMVPYNQEVFVDCKNTDFGKSVKLDCKVGCIGCKLCEKNCSFDAIKVENNIATIDYDKCTECMVCVLKCPTKAITADLDKRKKAVIIDEKCIGCTICAKKCPVNAIEGEVKKLHKIIDEKCIGCGVCEEKCPKDAIEMR